MIALAAAISPILDAQRQLKAEGMAGQHTDEKKLDAAESKDDAGQEDEQSVSTPSASLSTSDEINEPTASKPVSKRPATVASQDDSGEKRRRVSGKTSEK